MLRSALPALGITIFCLLFVGACSPHNHNVNLELGQATLYTNVPVRKLEQSKVSLRPKNSPAGSPSAIMLPLKMRQNMTRGYQVSGEISRVFWTAWLDQEVFPAFQYIDNPRIQTNRQDDAIAMARSMGADLAVYGEISYLISGGSVDNTQLALRVQIVDARSGQLLWILEDSGFVAKMSQQDWLFLKHEGRMPDDPLYLITQAIAVDMAAPVRAWSRAGYDSKPSSWGGRDPAPAESGSGLSDRPTSPPASSAPEPGATPPPTEPQDAQPPGRDVDMLPPSGSPGGHDPETGAVIFK